MIRPPALLTAAALVLHACQGGPPPPPASAPAPAAGPTPEATASAGARVRAAGPHALTEAPARVVAGPGASAVVAPPLPARVVKVRVRPGDAVAAGAPLVDVVLPELLEAAARLRGARGRLAAAEARAQQLDALRAEGLARAADQSEAALKVAEARADVESARALLLSAGVREDEAGRLLDGGGVVPLRAPFAAVVSRVGAVQGQVRAPDGEPLVELQAQGEVRVEARFTAPPPLKAGWDFVGQDGQRTPLDPVSRAPSASPSDGSRLAWFQPTPGSALTAGAPGRVVLRPERNQVLVPARAVRREGDRATVQAPGGDEVQVRVLACTGSDCLVQGPLAPGDALAVPVREGP